MKLTVKDRISMPYLFPQSHNIVTMLAVKELYNKIRLTQDDVKRVKLVVNEGKVSWDEKNEFEIEVSFNNLELNLLKERVEVLDKQKAVNDDVLDLCVKIRAEK